MLATFEKGYQELVDNERVAARRLMEQQKKEAIELSKIEVEYKPLQRAAEQNTKMYGAHREPAERDRHHRPDEDEQRARAGARDRARLRRCGPSRCRTCCSACCSASGPASALAFAIEALDNTLKTQADVEQFLGVPVLGLVPIIGAAPGGEAAQAGRQPARARPGRVPGSEVGRGRVLPIDPHQHPVHVAGPSAPDDGRHQPEPAGGEDDHRDQPRRHDGRGRRTRADRRHRHAPAAPAPLVRRPQPDRHLDASSSARRRWRRPSSAPTSRTSTC